MAKQTQSKSKADVVDTTTPVSTNSAAPVAASADKSAKKVKAPKASASPAVETKVAEPVVSTPVVSASVEESAPAGDDTADLVAQSTDFLAKFNQLSTLFASLKTEFRALEKRWSREIKTAQKCQSKRKRKPGNRQPSGFVKPTKISDELAKFLDKPVGTEMARTEVTKQINAYIKSNKLQDNANGRHINPDAKLKALLKLKSSDELTYFNLQKYMSPHFTKAAKPAATATA